jgi:hypothetical protein
MSAPYQPGVRLPRRPFITAREFAAGFFIGFTVTLVMALIAGGV